MTTATNAWKRKHTAVERRALEAIVDKLLAARLGYSGKDDQEQREFTMTWAKVFLEALLEDRKAATALVSALRIPDVAGRRLRMSGEDEKDALIRDIRRRLPMVRIGHPELADQIERAMDVVSAEALS